MANLRYQGRSAKIVWVSKEIQSAFPLGDGYVICPVCSHEQRVPASARVQSREGDNIFRCGGGFEPRSHPPRPKDPEGCGWQFLTTP